MILEKENPIFMDLNTFAQLSITCLPWTTSWQQDFFKPIILNQG